MEVGEDIVHKIGRKIKADANYYEKKAEKIVFFSYYYEDFEMLEIDRKTFNDLMGYLPNFKFKNSLVVLSVSFDKRTKQYEVMVQKTV